MTASLNTTNNMLRGIGINVPYHDDRIFDPDFNHIEQEPGGMDDPTVMDVAGWSDDMGVDVFMSDFPIDGLFAYAAGMGFDFDA